MLFILLEQTTLHKSSSTLFFSTTIWFLKTWIFQGKTASTNFQAQNKAQLTNNKAVSNKQATLKSFMPTKSFVISNSKEM